MHSLSLEWKDCDMNGFTHFTSHTVLKKKKRSESHMSKEIRFQPLEPHSSMCRILAVQWKYAVLS